MSDLKFWTGDFLTKLNDNEIFVFGSNPEGRHGAGAALVAKNQFGAVYGQGEGLHGNSYALPTKDLRVKENNGFRSISKQDIINNIKKLYETAAQNPQYKFEIAYTNGINEKSLNGYTGGEMMDMFIEAGKIPNNIIFSKTWFDTGKFNNDVYQQLNENTTDKQNILSEEDQRKAEEIKKHCKGE